MYQKLSLFQKTKKKNPYLVPIALIILLVGGYTFLIKDTDQFRQDQIAVVSVYNTILSSDSILNQLNYFSQQESVRAIILRIDSPGGSLAASQEIYDKVIEVRNNKPVYVSMQDIAASGGYLIALAGEQIYANGGTLTGSIGVILQGYNISKLLNMIGIQPFTVTAGKNKDLGSNFRELTQEDRKKLQMLLDDAHSQFKGAVVKSRGLDKDFVDTIADGSVFTGKQALELNLIDGLGSISLVKKKLEEDYGFPHTELIYTKKSFFEEYFGQIKSVSQFFLQIQKFNQLKIFSILH